MSAYVDLIKLRREKRRAKLQHSETSTSSSKPNNERNNVTFVAMNTTVASNTSTPSTKSSLSSQGRHSYTGMLDFAADTQKVESHINSIVCQTQFCSTLSHDDVPVKITKRGLVQTRLYRFAEDVQRKKSVLAALVSMFASCLKPLSATVFPVPDFDKHIQMNLTEDVPLCQYCFAASFNMLKPDGRYKNTWQQARLQICQPASAIDNDDLFFVNANGRTHGAVPRLSTVETYNDDEIRFLTWLYGYAKRGYGERSAVDGAFHMQYCTKQQIMNIYSDRCKDLGEAPIADRRMRDVLRKLRKKNWIPPGDNAPLLVRFSKWSAFGKCALCICLVLEIKKTLNRGKRAYLLALLQCHREVAYQEKVTWYLVREQAISEGFLWSFGADNLDKRKTRFINLGAELKGYGCDDLHTISATLGVIPVAGIGNFVYIASPLLPDNSNLILETLHLTLMYVTSHLPQTMEKPPAEWDLQVDGCRVNKNRTKWAYMAWLCVTHQMKKCSDNYMIVGHTHDLMDAILAIISRWIKQGCIITTMADLVQAVWSAFKQSYTTPVAVVVLNSVHNWTMFFKDHVAPIEKFASHVPDHERPHRFEVWQDPITQKPVMYYKNLRQQTYYWSKEPILLLPNGYKDFSELQVQKPSNFSDMKKHLRCLAASRSQFLRAFELTHNDALQSVIGHTKQHWTEFWDMFSETYTHTYVDDEGINKTSKKSRLKEDLSELEAYFETNVSKLAVLPNVTHVPTRQEIPKVVHAIPPVAPITVNKKGFDKINQGVDAKHLNAFIQGAEDTACVKAARRCLQNLAKPVKPKKQNEQAGPKETSQDIASFIANNPVAEFAAIRRQTLSDFPDLQGGLQDTENPTCDSATEYKVEEACIGVQFQIQTDVKSSVDTEDIYVGLQWATESLLPDECSYLWQSSQTAFDNNEDFEDAFNETWTQNREKASNTNKRWQCAFSDCNIDINTSAGA